MKEVLDTVERSGLVVILGGHRSGKTSLGREAGKRMLDIGKVGTVVMNDLGSMSNLSPDEVIRDINEEIKDSQVGRGRKKNKQAIVLFDEIEPYPNVLKEELLEKISYLMNDGHKIILLLSSDMEGDYKYLPKSFRDKLLELLRSSDSSPILNGLLTDEEVSVLVRGNGAEPVFNPEVSDILVRESGGHPFLANLLASDSVNHLSFHDLNIGQFGDYIDGLMGERFDNFKDVVSDILKVGYDPITWEWNGGGNKPDVEFYKNTIPRHTAKLFYKYLKEYLIEIGYYSKEETQIE